MPGPAPGIEEADAALESARCGETDARRLRAEGLGGGTWGGGAESGNRAALWGRGVLCPGPAEGPWKEEEVPCVLALPHWWLTPQRWCQEPSPPLRSHGPPLPGPWLTSCPSPSPGSAHSAPHGLGQPPSCPFARGHLILPGPLDGGHVFPLADGKTGAQMGPLNVTCQNSDGLRARFCVLSTKVERNESMSE